MQGCGNDYIYVDCFFQKMPADPAALAIRLSNRHFGIGADGLILIAHSQKADARMIMYNADGTESEMCGNGIRCVAKYVYDTGLKRSDSVSIETGAGIKEITVTAQNAKAVSARVNMGPPILTPSDIPVLQDGQNIVDATLTVEERLFQFTAVSMGNPHCIIYVDDVKKIDIAHWGPKIEHHPLFPKRINVEFVQVVNTGEVIQRTWERGSGETLACGTGASAVCVAGVLTGRTHEKMVNHLLGGDLLLEWESRESPVFMTGPCVEVFRGEVEI